MKIARLSSCKNFVSKREKKVRERRQVRDTTTNSVVVECHKAPS